MPCVKELFFHLIGMAGRMRDIDCQKRRRHESEELKVKSEEYENTIGSKKKEARSKKSGDSGIGTRG